MFGLNAGEFGLVTFMVVAILSARFWLKMGERLALRMAGFDKERPDAAAPAAEEDERDERDE